LIATTTNASAATAITNANSGAISIKVLGKV
jgi:hypothetical protein